MGPTTVLTAKLEAAEEGFHQWAEPPPAANMKMDMTNVNRRLLRVESIQEFSFRLQMLLQF